ncbi:MAG: thiamine-phosphate kinase [Candidatus Kariarchaeaceae archaeon]
MTDSKDNEQTKGEQHLLKFIKKHVDQSGNNLLGYDEDAIAIRIGTELLVLNVDGWVASTDRTMGMSYHDCGYRSVINAASDIIAKGAELAGMIVSLSLPKQLSNHTTEIVSGISNAARDYKIGYYGGDLNSANDIVIDVVIWGICKNKLIKRNGAKAGQKLCWLGPPLGSTAAALGVLEHNWGSSKEAYAKSIEIMTKPALFPEFAKIGASAAIDCSDGLALSLYHLHSSSNVGFDLLPIDTTDDWIIETATLNNKNIQDLALYGGEELAVIFTCDPEIILPESVKILGKVTTEKRVMIDGIEVENKGWEHFVD